MRTGVSGLYEVSFCSGIQKYRSGFSRLPTPVNDGSALYSAALFGQAIRGPSAVIAFRSKQPTVKGGLVLDSRVDLLICECGAREKDTVRSIAPPTKRSPRRGSGPLCLIFQALCCHVPASLFDCLANRPQSGAQRMYRVITCNTNGIRAAARKGFFDWLASQKADVVCIQEIKAKEEQLTDEVFYPKGYHCYYNEAERPGYAGTAIFCKQKPQKVITRLDWEIVDSKVATYRWISPASALCRCMYRRAQRQRSPRRARTGLWSPFMSTSRR